MKEDNTLNKLLKINFTAIFFLVLAVSSVNAQNTSSRLVGISSSGPSGLYSINPATGEATLITNLNGSASFTGLSFINGIIYASDLLNFPGSMVGEFSTGSISRSGVIRPLSTQNGSINWWGLASDDCDGRVLYTIDINNDNILTVQLLDGSVETIGSGTGIRASGMAYDDANGILYAVASEDIFDLSLYTVSIEDGTSSLIGFIGEEFVADLAGLAYDEDNQILYLNDGPNGLLYTLDVTTGEASLVGSNNVNAVIDGIGWLETCPVVRPIPTLSEWGLLAMSAVLGIIGILNLLRRTKTRALTD